jgi:hypothetical protein
MIANGRAVAATAIALAVAGCPPGKPNLLHQRGASVWIMDGAGKNAKSIAPGTTPRWIWAGRTHFAYFVPAPPVGAQSVGTLHVVTWDDAKQSVVSDVAVTDATAGDHFAWSRDGLWLVFESYRDGNWEIYKVRRDGSQLTNLTKAPAAKDREPAWARPGPVNGKIAFVSDRDASRDLFVMDENGGGLANLTAAIPGLDGKPDGGDDFAPTWASDGDRIAFVGTHQAWSNYLPQVYLTTVSQPGSLAVLSDTAAGAHLAPTWVDTNTLLYLGAYSGGKLWRHELKTGTRTAIAGNVGGGAGQCTADAVELFVGTPQGQIEAVQWHTGQKRLVGPGFNPCNGGDCH